MDEPLTHYVPFWHHDDLRTGTAEAICGAQIPEAESTAMPSCPRCDAYFAIITRRLTEEMNTP